MEILGELFNFDDFMPHGHCFLWQPGILWTKVISDALIALAYYSIPLALVIATRRSKNWPANWILIMFSIFIFACGTTHLVDILTIWYPNYWLDAGLKAVTAVVSVATAIALWPIVARVNEYVDTQKRDNKAQESANTELRSAMLDLEDQKQNLQRINNLSSVLDVCKNFDEICHAISDTIASLWPDSSGGIFIHSELTSNDDDSFNLKASWGNSDKLSTFIDANECWSYRLGHSFPDDRTSYGISCGACACGKVANTVCIPVVAGGKTLVLVQTRNIDSMHNAKIKSTLGLLIERSGLAINNLRLQQILEYNSSRDGLTSLYNRRYLNESVTLEFKRALRTEKPLSLIMFDIDEFKKLNDSRGHDAGDHALKHFAELMQNNLREGDLACRYGGEEFMLVLPETDNQHAINLAERIRNSVDKAFKNNRANESYTVSAGVATYPDNGSTSKDIMKAVDQALYKAKDNGRNRVESA